MELLSDTASVLLLAATEEEGGGSFLVQPGSG